MTGNLTAVVMPKWGLAMLEGMVSKWHVQEGAEIRPGLEICDIETSKIANAMESQVAGRILRRVAAEGATLPVGALLAVVGDGKASADEIDAFVSKFEAEFAAVISQAAAEGPASRKLQVDDRQINYLKLGSAESAPIIFVHGFGSDLNSWMFNQPQLAQTHTTYALDLPGHGESDKQVQEGSVIEFAEAVAKFMDGLNIDRAHLVGQSLGGAIAMQLSASHPEKAASLTLISTAGLGPDINIPYIEAFIGATGRKDLKPELEKLFADPQQVSRDMINNVLKYKRMDGVEQVLKAIAASCFAGGRQSTVMREHLAGFKGPIQVIFGERDAIIPARHAEGLPPDIRVHIIAAAGHMPHMEAASEVNRLIAEVAK
jgi:pyruvate dehydrogenase E2 component (dihydrolipoamide acetyltransferase)